jgi:non-ribosomal peptide synthetase component F
LQQQDLSKAEMFWRQALQGLKAPTPLTNLYVDNLSSQQERYDYQRNSLSQATTAALQSFARQHQLTLNTIIQGAWAFLLSRYSGEKKVVYGCTVAGRPVDLVGADSMVGTLINTLPVWIDVDGEQSLLMWLRQLQKQLVEMRQYEYSPLVEIQGWSEMPRGLPLFDSIVVFEKVPLLSALKSRQGELEIEMTHIWYKTNYPLNVVVYPMSELTIEIAYDCCRFEESAIATILTHCEILLQGMLTNPNLQLKDLQLLTASQQRITSMLENEVTFDFAACH